MVKHLRPATWIVCLAPLAWIGILIGQEIQAPGSALGADPGEVVVRYLGEWSIRFLLLALTIGSLARFAGFKPLLRVRRLVGLFAFGYVCLHLSSYSGLLAGFDGERLADDLVERPYILVGFASFLILIPLAVTSTRRWQRDLGAGWKRLHRLGYVAALLAVLHLVWLSKASYGAALLYGAWFALLMLERLPRVRPMRGKSPI